MKIKNIENQKNIELIYPDFRKTFLWIILVIFIFIVMILVVSIRGEFASLRKILYQNSFFQSLINQREDTIVTAKATRLVFDTPAFDQLKIFISDPHAFDPTLLEEYRIYYEKVIASLPLIAEAHEILGVIYYYQNEQSKVMDAFQLTLNIQPKFFWSLYNVGAIYYLNQKYDKSAFFFHKALETDPKQNLEYIYNSRVFNQIYWEKKDWNDLEVRKSLGQGYSLARQLLLKSYYYEGKFENTISLSKKFIDADLDEKGEFYFLAGAAFFERKEFSDAMIYFRRGIERGKEDDQGYYYAARCAQALGQKSISEEYLKKIKRQDRTTHPMSWVIQNPIIKIF